MSSEHPLEDVFEEAMESSEDDSVSLRDLLKQFDDRSFGPVFTLLGLLTVVPPLGGIPGLPAVIGVVILLFSSQMLLGRSHIWLPGFIADRSISKSKIQKAHDTSEETLEHVDRVVTDRLVWATSGPARYIAALLVSLMALIMIPLELVPFAVAIPGLAITFVGVALLARDGALMLLAYALSACALTVLVIYSPISEWLGL